MRILDPFRSLPLDLSQTLRSFSRQKALVAVAVLSLALGIGANAALFSVARAVLDTPLPYAEPHRLVRVWESFQAPGGGRWTGAVSAPNLVDWRTRSTRLQTLGAYDSGSVNLTSGGVPRRATAIRMEPQVFEALGVPAARGRVLLDGDLKGDGRVAVLSNGLWRTRYGADPQLVGETIELGGEAFQVLGVMPAEFDFPPHAGADLWLPLVFEPEHYADASRGNHWLSVVARLAANASQEAAVVEMEGIAAQLAAEHPEEQANRSVLLRDLQESLIGDSRPVVFALWGAVGFVLLIASGNVAHLLLARAARRRQEMALRSALGGGRSHLAVLVMLEAALLALVGGGLGLLLGRWAVDRLAGLPGSTLPAGLEISLDMTVFAYALGVGVLAAVLAGAAPAWAASKIDVRASLHSARGGLGQRDFLRRALVVAEVALALIVTLGAALMVRSLAALHDVDTGLDTENVLTLRVPLPEERYREADLPATVKRLHEAVSAVPGVEKAGWIQMLPVEDWGWNGKVMVEGEPPPDDEDPWVEYRVIAGDYFAAMGIPLLTGRAFELRDDADAAGVVVINRTLAKLYWGDENPLGARLGFGGAPRGEDDWLRVVGVVEDVKNAGLHLPPRPEVYVPAAQRPLHEMTLVARTGVAPRTLSESIRRAVVGVDPLQPVYRVQTLQEVVNRSVAGRSFNTLLLSIFAGLALLLALVGVYSVMSYDVGRRRSEVGLRMALGSDPAKVLRLFVARGLRLASLGTILGSVGALGATRLLEHRLYGIEATDPGTYLAAAAFLISVTAGASLLPAWRAARVEPTEALRAE